MPPLLCDGVEAWLLLEDKDEVEEFVEWHGTCRFDEFGPILNDEDAAEAALLGDTFSLLLFFMGDGLEYGLNEVEGDECIGVVVGP